MSKPFQNIGEGIRRITRKRGAKKLMIGGGLGLSILITSCMTVNGPVLTLPANAGAPGATFVGSEECSFCHEDVTGSFHGATHAKIGLRNEEGVSIGCEACHGPGSLHAENGGEVPGQIINPGDDPESCFQCHLDKKGQFHLPSAHPVMEGRVSCNDCHNPHEGSAVMGGGTALKTANQTCMECHDAQAGPHIFEHEAMRDGCTTCHDPHGSVNDKMLVVRNANLCLQCHFEIGSPVTDEADDGFHSRNRLSSGACWSAGCHEAVHGSNSSSALRY